MCADAAFASFSAWREAVTFDWRLRHTLDGVRWIDANQFEHRRHHVDRMRILRADLALRLDALRPVHDEGIADPPAIGLALPTAERRVARKRPAPRVVVERVRSAQVVDHREVLVQVVRHVVEELVLVHRAVRTTLRAGAVVGDEHDDRVVPLADALQELEQAAVVVVGVLQEAREHFHHSRVELLLVSRQRVPVLNVRVVARQLRILRDNPERLLTRERLLAIRVPPVVEHALVLVGPLLGDVMRRVHRARAEVHEERLVRGDLLGVGDEGHRLVHEVFGQVIALFGRLLGLDGVIVVDQLGIVLMGVAAEKPVVPLEPAPERPPVVRASRGNLVRRRQVPLAERVRVVSVLQQDLGQHPVLERDVAVPAGIAGGPFRDARHRVRMVIAAGQDARARRRAERGRVHVVEEESVLRERVDVRRLDRAAVAPHLPEPGIVLDDEDHVGRALFRPQRPRPRRTGDVEGASDHAGEGRAWFVFLERHGEFLR